MALKDKLMTLEDFKAVRDVDVASNSAQFTEIKADLGDVTGFSRYHPDYDYLVLDGDGYVLYDYKEQEIPEEITQLPRYYPYNLILDKDGYVVYTDEKAVSQPLKGLKLSIIGDSISTFKQWVPTGYSAKYPESDVITIHDIWWGRLIDKTGMELCVNASWSGSGVAYDITSATNAFSGASDQRIADLTNPTTQAEPDIIICYISTNDWGLNKEIGTYSSKMTIPFSGAVTTISEGYALMLYKLRNAYPDAIIYCATNIDGRHSAGGDEDFPILNDNNETLHEVNHMIIELAHIFGARVLDLETCGIHPWNISDYTLDGHLHPNKKGFDLIADTMYRQIVRDFE